ncbi:hypothetical protein [Bremerella volcania]|nr:hypothetical protein [Bremerella volcania]
MSVNEFKQASPLILKAMAFEIGAIQSFIETKREEVAKTAQAYGELIPYETFRDEKVTNFDEVLSPASSDPNAILDSLFVFPDPE